MRRNMIMTYLLACSLGVITTGCSTFSKDPNKMVEVPAGKLDNIPQWFLQPDATDKAFIIVTATDISKDMQFAIDKATLNAKIQISERLKTDVDSLTRETVNESGGSTDKEVDRVSKVRVKQTIGFFKRENVAVVKEGDSYRAFVMFKIAVEDARRLTKKDDTTREEKFKELEQGALLDVDNPEYKQRRAEALLKPNAVVQQFTVR